jgi:hypothetical protein
MGMPGDNITCHLSLKFPLPIEPGMITIIIFKKEKI